MFKIGSKIDEIRIDGDLDKLRKDLEHYAAMGLQAVEIPVHGLDVIKNGLLDGRRLREVQHLLRDFDFIYSVHSPNPLNLMDPWESTLHLSVFEASLRFTEAIGSRILVYHAGRFIPEEAFPIPQPHKLSLEETLKFMERERESLVELALRHPGVTICIENARPYRYHSPYCYGERIDILKEQVETMNLPNVKINLDIGHLYMAARYYQFDSVDAVVSIRDLIVHTHVHDNFGGTVYSHEKIQTHQIPFGRGDAHMPVGWGGIPLSEILSVYCPSYSGLLMMELRNRYFHDTGESFDNLRCVLDAIHKSSSNEAAFHLG